MALNSFRTWGVVSPKELLDLLDVSDNGMQDFISHTGCPLRLIIQFTSHTGPLVEENRIILHTGC